MNSREKILVYLAWINQPLITVFKAIIFCDIIHQAFHEAIKKMIIVSLIENMCYNEEKASPEWCLVSLNHGFRAQETLFKAQRKKSRFWINPGLFYTVLQDVIGLLHEFPILLQDWICEYSLGGKGDIKVGKGI